MRAGYYRQDDLDWALQAFPTTVKSGLYHVRVKNPKVLMKYTILSQDKKKTPNITFSPASFCY